MSDKTIQINGGCHTDGTGDGRCVLVIGGAGYIGSVLTRKLLLRGYDVRVLDKLIYDNGSSIADLVDESNFTFSRGDLCGGENVDLSLEGATDVVLLAALVGDPICKKYPALARETNETGAMKLFDLLSGRGIDKFVFTSTCSNYGLIEDGEDATEESGLNPQSLYAETKVNFEKYIMGKMDSLDFCPTILRLSTAFGISGRMRFDLTVSEFTRELSLGEELLVYDENTWRPYCHVSDISSAIISVIESPIETVRGEVFNVGDNKNNYTKQMIVDAVLDNLGEGNVTYGESGPDKRNYRVSFDKIRERLGYSTSFSMDGSILTLIEALKNGLFDDVDSRKFFYGNYSIGSAGTA